MAYIILQLLRLLDEINSRFNTSIYKERNIYLAKKRMIITIFVIPLVRSNF
jgi:hypothetical protein